MNKVEVEAIEKEVRLKLYDELHLADHSDKIWELDAMKKWVGHILQLQALDLDKERINKEVNRFLYFVCEVFNQ